MLARDRDTRQLGRLAEPRDGRHSPELALNMEPHADRLQEIATARAEMEALRTERNVRLQLRDNALFGYLAASAALGGVAFGQSSHVEVMLMVPYLAPAVAGIVVQHHSVIGRREAFVAAELMPYLRDRGAWAPCKVPSGERLRREIWTRTLAHVVALFIPTLIALVFNLPDVRAASPYIQGRWWIALGCALLTGVILGRSHRDRMKLAKDTDRVRMLGMPGQGLPSPAQLSPSGFPQPGQESVIVAPAITLALPQNAQQSPNPSGVSRRAARRKRG